MACNEIVSLLVYSLISHLCYIILAMFYVHRITLILVIRDITIKKMSDRLWLPIWIRLQVGGKAGSSMYYNGVKEGTTDAAEQ